MKFAKSVKNKLHNHLHWILQGKVSTQFTQLEIRSQIATQLNNQLEDQLEDQLDIQIYNALTRN